MDTDSMKLRQSLLSCVGCNKEKLDNYLEQLIYCNKAYDVAHRVIRPIFVNEGLEEKKVCMRAFYGTIAQLTPQKDGKAVVKPDALYYHIVANLPKWKEEQKERKKTQQESDELIDTVIELSPQGEIDVKIHIRSKKLPSTLEELLKPYIQHGYARLSQKEVKSLDARTGGTMMELACPLQLMPDFLLLLQEHEVDAVVTYLSHYTRRQNISIEEALEIAMTEIEESNE